MGRVARILTTGTVTLAAAGLAGAPAGARMPAGAAKAKPVKLTGKTVTVSAATVRKYLVAVSKDRTTFKFRRSAGSLKKLKRGKVMLLKGKDVAVVTKVSHSKGKLIVTTRAAKLTDIVKSGRITFKGTPDLRKAFVTHTTTTGRSASAARAGAEFEAPGYPYLGPPPSARRAHAAAGGPSFSIQGSAGNFGYSLTFTPTSRTRMDISGVLCFQLGSICSNGPSNGVSAEVNISGYFDTGPEDVGITVDGGSITQSSIGIKNLIGHAKVKYTISRGEGDADKSPPVLRIPAGVDYSVPGPYGIPLYFKLQAALLLKFGVSSKNAVIRGGADVTTSGNDTIETKGKTVSVSDTGATAKGGILDHANGDVGSSISLAPSGVVVAVQFPKLGFGVGVRLANAIGYIDVVTSVGQTVGAALAGMFCSKYDLFLTVGGGFEAQAGFLALASPKKTLYERQAHVSEPGCG